LTPDLCIHYTQLGALDGSSFSVGPSYFLAPKRLVRLEIQADRLTCTVENVYFIQADPGLEKKNFALPSMTGKGAGHGLDPIR
jgi:hypothetical protein